MCDVSDISLLSFSTNKAMFYLILQSSFFFVTNSRGVIFRDFKFIFQKSEVMKVL